MLKFVIIGVLFIGLFAFVMWNFWKMILLKHKYYTESQSFLFFIDKFEDVPLKLKSIKKDKIIIWITAVLVSLLVVALSLSYFLIARNIFIGNHSHNYKDSVVTKPTCVTEGTLQYKCRYCDDKYEELISTVEHKYSESNRYDSTCAQEGKIEYTCEMCADTKTESIPLKEHKYTKKIEKDASCTNEGVLAKQCKNCDYVTKENIPVNDEHRFEVSSFKASSFWGNGYNHYLCQDCGTVDYAPRVETFNWIIVLSIVVFVIAVIVIIYVRADEGFWCYTFGRPLFWVSLIFAIVSVAIMICHFCVIIPHQQVNKPVFQKIAGAPVECVLIEIDRTESTYTENGTILYKCQKCNKEYTEYLDLKEIDVEHISIYTEPEITVRNESENNNKINNADEIPLSTIVTGKLSSTKDVDFYKVTLLTDGNIKFKFTHDGDQYSNHWNATIYDTDKSTVLNEGYIDKEEFGSSSLPAGAYYLKISVISGGNPIMNTYSDANYYVMFVPECTEHTEKVQYFSEIPSCMKSLEITTICNNCGTIVSVENQKELEHNWSEWSTTKPSTAWSLGEKTRTCTLCNETQDSKDYTYWWVIPLIILEFLLLVVCSAVLFRIPKRHMVYILLLLVLSCIASTAILNTPIFDAKIWDGLALGIILAFNTTPIVVFSCFMIDSMARKRYYIYETTPITLSIIFAIMLILGCTAFSGYAITVVLVMATLAINAIAWSITAYNDREKGWMAANIIVAMINIVSGIFFYLKV